MKPSIYVPGNYENVCSRPYQIWRRFHQWIAKLFPPDWIYIVWAQNVPGESAVWIYGIYLHLADAKAAEAEFLRNNPNGWAEWEQRGLQE